MSLKNNATTMKGIELNNCPNFLEDSLSLSLSRALSLSLSRALSLSLSLSLSRSLSLSLSLSLNPSYGVPEHLDYPSYL